MKFSWFMICIGIISLISLYIYYKFIRNRPSPVDFAIYQVIIDKLHSKEVVSEADPQEILDNCSKIYIIATPLKGESPSEGKEGYSFPLNVKIWPQYYYSYPYLKSSSAITNFPPNMYSSFYYLSPGFNTSGWGYWLRPGVSDLMVKGELPRGRWLRNNGNYYFVSNSTFPQNNKLDIYY